MCMLLTAYSLTIARIMLHVIESFLCTQKEQKMKQQRRRPYVQQLKQRRPPRCRFALKCKKAPFFATPLLPPQARRAAEDNFFQSLLSTQASDSAAGNRGGTLERASTYAHTCSCHERVRSDCECNSRQRVSSERARDSRQDSTIRTKLSSNEDRSTTKPPQQTHQHLLSNVREACDKKHQSVVSRNVLRPA